MIYDIFTFNGEYDTLEIRLNILNEYVDQFIIVECPTTFSGLAKPLYYEEGKERFKKWHGKIKYFVVDENYSADEIAVAESSPYTKGADHWKHEFLQKKSIEKALTHLKDDDICFVGDVDEIWDPGIALKCCHDPAKYNLRVYSYYLNNRSNEVFWGTLASQYVHIRNSCLNNLRVTAPKTDFYAGWHFTSMGGYEEMRRKLKDSYTHESYWNIKVRTLLKMNIFLNRDFLGRGYRLTIDESEWPQYLKENKKKYGHLLRAR